MQPAPAADGKVTVNSACAAVDSCDTGQAHSQLLLLMRVVHQEDESAPHHIAGCQISVCLPAHGAAVGIAHLLTTGTLDRVWWTIASRVLFCCIIPCNRCCSQLGFCTDDNTFYCKRISCRPELSPSSTSCNLTHIIYNHPKRSYHHWVVKWVNLTLDGFTRPVSAPTRCGYASGIGLARRIEFGVETVIIDGARVSKSKLSSPTACVHCPCIGTSDCCTHQCLCKAINQAGHAGYC